MADLPTDAEPRRRPPALAAGWRGLGLFWLVVLLLCIVVVTTLQLLGPPGPALPRQTASSPPINPPHPPAPKVAVVQSQDTRASSEHRPGRDTPGPVADPDPDLLEPVSGQPTDFLPRIASDGRAPMQVYAAGFDRSTRRPRVGLLLAGVGLNQSDSETAIHSLPGGITLAISPYANDPAKLVASARLAEHEYLISIPMEPVGYPLNDPGPHALMANLPPEQDQERLDWALSRITGYVGATGALGTMRGERRAGMAEQMDSVLSTLAKRGLLYVDPRPGSTGLPLVWSRRVDLIIDEPGGAPEIDDKLAQLSRLAREKGSALGLAGAVRPVTTDRIAAWANGLVADGLALAPVSALVQSPSGAMPK